MMRLVISTGELARVMKIARKVMPNKSSMPAYELVHLFMEGEDFFLRAQNEEEAVTFRVPFHLEGGNFMEVALPIVRLNDILSALPEQPLTMTFNDEPCNVEISYQNGHYQLPYGSTKDIPVPQEVDGGVTIDLPTGIICGAMRIASLHVADDVLRPVMTAVAMDIQKNNSTIVASNGHTLFLDRYVCGSNSKESPMALLTARSVMLLDTALQQSDEATVRFTTNGRNMRVVGKDFILQSRQVEGRYPNYNSVIPQQRNHRVVLNKKALSSALRRVLLMGDTRSRLVEFDFSKGNFNLRARDVDFSTSATETIEPTQSDITGDFRIGFRGDLLSRCLDSLDSEDIEFSLVDSSVAAILREVEGKTDKLVLLMPMMLND